MTPPPVVAALDMGYGHLRAAAAIAAVTGTHVVEADRPPVASPAEARAWLAARRLYEGLSRAADAWYAPGARRLLDLVTAIPGGPSRDLTAPNLGARRLAALVERGLGAGLAAHVRAADAPLVATFYAAAIAADAHGADRVHLVVTDSDVNRVWVAADAARSRVVHFAPTDGAARRLAQYGVPRERVHVTGFPLPPALTDDAALRASLARRLDRLDPSGAFRDERPREIDDALGCASPGAAGPVTLVYAVGGAGAQTGIARTLVASLGGAIRERRIRLVLVAGVRPKVAARFARWIADAKLTGAVEVVHESTIPAYLARFDAVLAAADVLWTKPSELTFYAALGLPLLLSEPLGAHERRNRELAVGLGAAIDASDTRRTARALPGLVADGSLAAAAWAGFTSMPRDGAARIAALVSRPGRAASHVLHAGTGTDSPRPPI